MKKTTKPTGDLPAVPPPPPAADSKASRELANRYAISYKEADALDGTALDAHDLANLLAISYSEAEAILA